MNIYKTVFDTESQGQKQDTKSVNSYININQ